MKIAATELMAETTNSDGSFQGFALRALSVPRPLSLLRQIPLSLPPYAGLSCPEHEGRLPLTLTALVSGRGRAADTDALAQGHRRSGTGIGREASLPFPRRVRHQGRSSASARPSAPTSGKTLRMRPKFHLDGLFSRGSTFQSVTSHQMSRMMSSCIRKKTARGLNLDLRLDSSPASCLPGERLSRLTDLLR